MPSDRSSIPEDIAFLSRLVHELEGQLKRLGSMNDALEHDLARERSRTTELQVHVEQLEKRIAAIGDSRPDNQALLERAARASAERSELAVQKRLLERQLHDLLAGHAGRQREDRLLHEKLAEAEVELASVESQLSRALRVAGAVELQVKTATLERDRLEEHVRAEEERVAAVRQERDALLAEIAASREALQKLQSSVTGRL